VLAEHDAIMDAAVVAKADNSLGEVPVAFAVPREGDALEPDELIAFCRERMSDYKVPVEIRTVDEIPRTGSGEDHAAPPPGAARGGLARVGL
jgi:acyl-CoA synthetase (AMP-forming)/AMP-acid ligase II